MELSSLTAEYPSRALLAETGLLLVFSLLALTTLAPAVGTRALFLTIGEASALKLLRPVNGTLSLLTDMSTVIFCEKGQLTTRVHQNCGC